MKNILTLLLVSGVIYLSSCGNGANDPVPVVPIADSTTTGSYFSIWFQSDTFFIRDVSLNGIPAVTLRSSAIYNATDSMWECRVKLNDVGHTRINLDITATNTSPTGSYTVKDNSSTLTDFSHGENKTYSIGIGSVINLSQSSYPIIGQMSLTLYYNHTTTYANDTFKIYH
jgi:hypothetical protein